MADTATSTAMRQDYVIFYSPGTLFAEESRVKISGWDVKRAIQESAAITERYNAHPYGFVFITRERGDDDLDSHESARSQMYYLGGKIETVAEIEAGMEDGTSKSILLSNMRCNDCPRVITTTRSGYRWTQPLTPSCTVLDDALVDHFIGQLSDG